jgi:hypothetical protein
MRGLVQSFPRRSFEDYTQEDATTDMTDIQDPPRFVDSPDAPEIFADLLSGTFWHSGVLRMTFESARINHEKHPGPLSRVVVGRIVMPITAAENMAKMILEAVEKSRSAAPVTPQTSSKMH